MSQHDREQLSFSPELTNASVEAGDCRMPMGWTSENVAGACRCSTLLSICSHLFRRRL
jgi:hypothetical protein